MMRDHRGARVTDEGDATAKALVDLSEASLSDVDAYGGSQLREAISRLLSEGTSVPVAGFDSSI